MWKRIRASELGRIRTGLLVALLVVGAAILTVTLILPDCDAFKQRLAAEHPEHATTILVMDSIPTPFGCSCWGSTGDECSRLEKCSVGPSQDLDCSVSVTCCLTF